MQQMMRGWVHAFSIVAGIAAPISFTFWVTSDGGARSKSHYAEVANTTMSPKDVVMAFDKLAFDERRPQEAVRRYFSVDSVDHDPKVKGDRTSVISMLEKLDWSKVGPQRTVKHIVADGEMVVVHHHLVRNPGTKGLMAVDLFRVANGKIVEHWDVLQPIPESSPNEVGAF